MSEKEGLKITPETYVEEFSKGFNPYLKDLNKGYLKSKDTNLTSGLVIKNSWKVLYRAMQKLSPARPNVMMIVAPLLAFIPAGFSIWNYPKYAVPIVAAAIVTYSLVMRSFTLKAMGTPGDELFHHKVYAKQNPRLKEALQKFYEDNYFDLERLLKDLKKESLDEKVRKDYADRIASLNNLIASLEKQLEEVKKNHNETEANYQEALEILIDTEEERDNYAKINEYITKFMEGMHTNLTLLIHNDFGQDFLRALKFDYKYSLYRLVNKPEQGFVHEGSSGINEAEVESFIKLEQKDNIVIQAYDNVTEEIEGQSRRYACVSRCINLSVEESWVVVLYFQRKELEDLKKDEDFASIKLNTVFDLFWVCLEIVSKYQTIKNELEEAANK